MAVILITGVPKAGKTTLAYRFKWYTNKVFVLDGDELRDAIDYRDFTKEGRDRWLDIVGNLAKIVEYQGYLPVIALVSPYKEARNKLRSKFIHSKLVWIKYSHKYMWESSTYEDPDESEEPFVIERKDDKEYTIPMELIKFIDGVK